MAHVGSLRSGPSPWTSFNLWCLDDFLSFQLWDRLKSRGITWAFGYPL